MQVTHSIPGPGRRGAYPGRDLDCANALRPIITEIAMRNRQVLAGAMAEEMTGELKVVVADAEVSGWSRGEATSAIARLARECEGAQGAIFD